MAVTAEGAVLRYNELRLDDSELELNGVGERRGDSVGERALYPEYCGEASELGLGNRSGVDGRLVGNKSNYINKIRSRNPHLS
jgi:hypothetical protein